MASQAESGRRPPRRRGKKGGAGGGRKDVSSVSPVIVRKNGSKSTATASPVGAGPASAAAACDYRPHKVALITLTEETPTWFQCGRNTPGRDDTLAAASSSSGAGAEPSIRRNPPDVVQRYRALGEKIYQHEVALSKQQSAAGSSAGSGRDEAWVESTMRRGTLKDRVAAMSVVVSTHPVHKLYALDMLLNMVGINIDRHSGQATSSPGRPNDRVAQLASEALADLFANTLLPTNRKLIAMDGRPLHLYDTDAKRTLSPRVLLLWRYEEHLKTRYAAYVEMYLSRTLSETTLDLNKTTTLRTASNLLTSLPEGESQLLSLIANKLGDPSRKVASAAGHQLRLVLEQHPAMTAVVAREVQQLAHRPHLSSRALYNCIVFLNQLKLRRGEEEYDNDNESASGGNVGDGDGDGDDNNNSNEMATKKRWSKKKKQQSLPASLINTYFRLFEVAIKKSEVARSKGKGKSKNKGNATNDDGTMRGRLLSALLTGVNRAHPYLPRKDTAMEEHVDALYRIAHTSPPAACTQALMLLYNLAVGSPDSNNTGGVIDHSNMPKAAQRPTKTDAASSARRDRFYRALYSKLSEPSMLCGRQITLFFNLVYKATKNDPDGVRAVACSKRLLHTAVHSSQSVVAASLFLVSEVMKSQPILEGAVHTPSSGVFDPSKREPRAAFVAGGDQASSADESQCSLWEITLATNHYHPTVQKFSSSLGQIKYSGDPLRDFALAPFLDKLAYRNPKSRERLLKHLKRGASVAERRSGLEKNLGARASLPMNDPSLLTDRRRTVGEDEEFFHTFFAERAKRDELKGGVRDVDEDDAEGSDAESEAIDAAEMEGAKKAVSDYMHIVLLDFCTFLRSQLIIAIFSCHCVRTFQQLEEGWNTDSSEEEFAQQLAEKLMEDTGNGQANFDDEDPDMEGWSDMDGSSDEDKDSDEDVDYSAMDGVEEAPFDSDGLASDSIDDEDFDADAFMDGDVSGDNSGSSDDDDDDDGFTAALLVDEDSDMDDAGNEVGKDVRIMEVGKRESPDKQEKYLEGFADAADYQHLIGQGWEDRKRGSSVPSDDDDDDDDDDDGLGALKTREEKAVASRSQRRRKRRKGN